MAEKPSQKELYEAEDTCWALAKYIEEKWPHATHEISVLEEAADILATHNSDDFGENEEEEKK